MEEGFSGTVSDNLSLGIKESRGRGVKDSSDIFKLQNPKSKILCSLESSNPFDTLFRRKTINE
jgi:hypothetical protein